MLGWNPLLSLVWRRATGELFGSVGFFVAHMYLGPHALTLTLNARLHRILPEGPSALVNLFRFFSLAL
jgi:hypothetical protein